MFQTEILLPGPARPEILLNDEDVFSLKRCNTIETDSIERRQMEVRAHAFSGLC